MVYDEMTTDLILIGISLYLLVNWLKTRSLLRATPPKPHEHRWITTSANSTYIRKNPISGTEMQITLLLRRCKCGEHNVSELSGKWTSDELGIDDKTVKDLLALLNELETENS